MKNNAVTDQEKREKKIVVKKLAEMEEELKVRTSLHSLLSHGSNTFSFWLSRRT